MLINFVKVYKTDCNLAALGIQEKISLLLEIILLTVKNKDCQREIDIHQNLISVGGENKDTPQQNNPTYPKCKQDGENERSWDTWLEKICT